MLMLQYLHHSFGNVSVSCTDLTILLYLLQWMKLDDLFEQERNIRMAMSNRMGVLGLMLHQTVDHDPMTPMKSTSC